MNKSTKTSSIGEWTNPTGKIGLMYGSDYILSLGNDALSKNLGTAHNMALLKTGWLHPSNNDITNETTAANTEWTISRSGLRDSNYQAFRIGVDGDIYSHDIIEKRGLRPVFYLESNVIASTGNGSYDEPFMIETNTIENNLQVEVSLKNNVITGNVTKGSYDLYKYCINDSATSTEGCTWKNIESKTITDTLNEVGNYTMHVMDKSGHIAHSNTVNLKSFADLLVASNKLWDSGLEDDGLRYVGSGDYNSETTPSNFICFGTTSSEECKADEDKYMYRIIGVFKDEEGTDHLKLRKFKQIGLYSWHSDYTTDTNWEDSSLYKGLNGSEFLENTTYSYLQANSWSDKISDWKWTAVNTKTADSGPNYNGDTTMTPANIYLHEMNRSTKITEVGEWTYPKGKIGVIYASDYVLSLGDTALSIIGSTSKNSALLSTGWLHPGNNGGKYEWTMARRGPWGTSGIPRFGWHVHSYLRDDGSVDTKFGVAPVFYLEKNVIKAGGTGTYQKPYIIAE